MSVLDVQAGYLRLLEESVAHRPQDQALVRGAADARAGLEEGLLRFQGIVAEGIPDLVSVDLSQELIGMIPLLARQVGDGSRLRIAPPVDPLPVRVNAGLLRRALAHLVENAREASRPGQSIRLSWGPASEGGAHREGWEGARIRVEDQGEGISREYLPWLFEPLFSSRRESHPMRGLGLPSARAIVEGHGGWLEVHSSHGEGTQEILFLPLEPREADSSQSGRSIGGRAEPPLAPRILLLEDEPLVAKLLEQTLSRAGYEVDLFTTQQESERHLRRAGVRADLMIVERILSGGRSGIEIASDWQRRQPDLRVIVIDRGLSAGARLPESDLEPGLRVVTPPFQPQEIVRRVEETLGRVGGGEERDPSEADSPDGGPSQLTESDRRLH